MLNALRRRLARLIDSGVEKLEEDHLALVRALTDTARELRYDFPSVGAAIDWVLQTTGHAPAGGARTLNELLGLLDEEYGAESPELGGRLRHWLELEAITSICESEDWQAVPAVTATARAVRRLRERSEEHVRVVS